MHGKVSAVTLVLVVVSVFLAPEALAGSVDGVAVGGAGSSTPVGLLENGRVKYFIPLSGANAGVYGVSPVSGGIAGTFSDVGKGYGYDSPSDDALQMYLRYDLAGLDVPALAAMAVFEFDDLDLKPYHDPSWFLEGIRFNYFDGAILLPLTNTLKHVTDDPTLVDGFATITVDPNNHDRITIQFPGLAPILNSLPPGSDAFYARLDFSSKVTSGICARNTRELLLSAVLTTSPLQIIAVPLPASAWVGFCVLGGMAVVRTVRRRSRGI